MADRPSCLFKKITILVGDDEEPFIVDKGTLLASSDFFRKVFDTSLNIKDPEEVDLPDVKPRAFEIYLWWLRTGIFYIMEQDDVDDSAEEDELGIINDEEYSKWDECYMLGHLVQDCDFQDACIDLMQEKMISEDVHMLEMPDTVYGIDVILPAHRQFAVDTAAHLWGELTFNNLEEDDNSRVFIIDLLKYVSTKMRHNKVAKEKPKDFFKDIGCKYHAHVALNKPCYKKTHPAYK
ncbi:hypothetical protein J4E83_009086 [Alternaria metachromatica]|uniref:uncharacterized protein n=1 Tax=Alternaria metachromatica TaxID=283354 RepID=UPI0020C538EF|nr:uncharacterized protein J4E83_009086 [Alternaria metachromatica]KAI4608649.1 hypothetical protein J4E83_009086 [Alternaria metachromatica]